MSDAFSTIRIPDEPAGVTPVFEWFPMRNEAKSKASGIPKFDDVAVVRITLAANRQTQGVFPANEIWRYETVQSEYGEDRVPITYAMRFQKQYQEFINGGKQSFSGTIISELPFLTQADRLNLKGLNVHTAEALAGLDGAPLKMLGPQGRDLKNQAIAYLANAKANAGSVELADQLSIRDAQIAELTRKLDSLTAVSGEKSEVSVAEPVSDKVVEGFADYEDDDLRSWLADAGVTVDKRWGRNTLLAKASEELAKTGKQKHAA